MKRCPILMLTLLVVACVAGCKTTGRTSPDANTPATTQSPAVKPPAIRSPALLAYCGVPIDEALAEYRRAREEKWVPDHSPKMLVVWTCPLRTENLSRVLPQAECLRICRICTNIRGPVVTVDSVVMTDDKKIMLLTDGTAVVEFLNNNHRFFPKTQADAEYILFAFAELCGCQLLTEPPKIMPASKRGESPYEREKRQEAAKLDFSISWSPCDNGWIVSCVFVTDHVGVVCGRYTIFICIDGTLKILKSEYVFSMEYI